MTPRYGFTIVYVALMVSLRRSGRSVSTTAGRGRSSFGSDTTTFATPSGAGISHTPIFVTTPKFACVNAPSQIGP